MEALQYYTMYDFRCSSTYSNPSTSTTTTTSHSQGSESPSATLTSQLSHSSASKMFELSAARSSGENIYDSPCRLGLQVPLDTVVYSNGVNFPCRNNNNHIMMDMESGSAVTDQQGQLIDPTIEPQTRTRCNTWPLRPIIDPPSIHDSESNPADGVSVIKEEPENFQQTDLSVVDDDPQSQHNLSGGPDHLNISNQLGINNSPELGSQGDLNNAKKQSARKNAWGK